MRNLTAPRQYEDERGTSFDAGCEGLVLTTPSGDPVRLHVADDGFLYVNGQPFGVQGMPAARHAGTHASGGGDALSAESLGAVALGAVGLSVAPLVGGVVPACHLAGQVQAARHAASHAAGGSDGLAPASIGAVAVGDARLSDARRPLAHAASHGRGGVDALSPAALGAVGLDDARLHDRRVPVEHGKTHAQNGADPLSWADVGSVDAGLFTVSQRVPGGYPQLNDLGHLDLNLLPAGLPPGPHARTHHVDGVDRVRPVEIDAADRVHAGQHGADGADRVRLDAAQIVSGVLELERLPAAALERLVPVDDLPALLGLGAGDVQNGDTVQTLDDGQMYRVVNAKRLGEMAAFTPYTASRAAAVAWSGVEGKPFAYPPQGHAGSHCVGAADALSAADVGAASLEQNAATMETARLGVNNAEAARLLAVAARSAADVADAKAVAAQGAAKGAQGTAEAAQIRADKGVSDAAVARSAAEAANAKAVAADAKAVAAQGAANAAKTQADRGVADAATSQATANAARADAERALVEMSGAGMPSNRIIALNAATLGSAGCAAPADGYVVCYAYTKLPATNLWFSLSNATVNIASQPLVFPDGNGFHCSISCKKGDLVKAHNPYPSLIACSAATFYYANGAI